MLEGSTLQAITADGSVISGRELIGTVMLVADRSGQERKLRIDNGWHDPLGPQGERLLYKIKTFESDTNSWIDLCQRDPQGQSVAMTIRQEPSGKGLAPDGPDGVEPETILRGPADRWTGTASQLCRARCCGAGGSASGAGTNGCIPTRSRPRWAIVYCRSICQPDW